MAIAYSQAELALRDGDRQEMLPRCVGCGALIKRGQGVSERCEERRTPLSAAAPRRRGLELHVEPPAPARFRAAPRHKPKACKEPSCRRVFTPTGGRSEFCEVCR